jgi:hypothetical protein
MFFSVKHFLAASIIVVFAVPVCVAALDRLAKKRISAGRILISALLAAYAAAVFGVAIVATAGTSIDSWAGIRPFSAYRAAWYSASSIGWRNILLNIAVFVPLGVLLPMMTDKIKLRKVLAIGFASALVIELVQLFITKAVFAADDVLNRTVGAIIGYCALQFALGIKKKGLAKSAAWLLPLAAVSAIFIAALVSYNLQEFGNMKETYIYRQDTGKMSMQSLIPLSDESPRSAVYKSGGMSTANETREFAESFFGLIGARLDDSQTKVYDETATYAAYTSDGERHSLFVDYNGLTYWYNGPGETPKAGAGANEIKDALLAFGVAIPESASFTELENGRYRFAASLGGGSEGIGGWLECVYYEGDIVGDIFNNLESVVLVKDVETISEKTAFEDIKAGRFQPYLHSMADSLKIVSVSMEHRKDTKGFFQPLYVFKAETEPGEIEIPIPAVH